MKCIDTDAKILMSPFPEEPLDLSPAEGGGYYAAEIHQKLQGGKYEIVRKLGYGPRSSTWLTLRAHDHKYSAVKIFTVAASERARSVQLPIVKVVPKLGAFIFKAFHGSFWEESSAGSHLCFVANPLSTSVRDMQRDAENHRLPVHAVQQIVSTVADSLLNLHRVKIMHGGIRFTITIYIRPC